MAKIFDENVWITLGGATRIIENDRRKDPRTSKANTMRTNHTLPNHWNPKTTHKKLNPRNTLVGMC
jgi:hypothetical protein